jgi:hypothetical protein
VVITVVGAGMSLGWRRAAEEWSQGRGDYLARVRDDVPSVYTSGCHAEFEEVDADAAGCTSGMPASGRTMVLFGDSHAAQWHPALQEMARQRGWRLVSLTKTACPAVDRRLGNRRLGRAYRECDAWRRDALREVRALRPDLVVVASSSAYDLSPVEWTRGTERILASLTRSAGTVALLRDTPNPGFDVAACVARSTWGLGALRDLECDAEPDGTADGGMYQALHRAAARYRNAYVVDTWPHVCPQSPCSMYRDGVLLFRDGDHLTAEFSATLSEELASQLKALALARSLPWPAPPPRRPIPARVSEIILAPGKPGA